MRFYRLTAVGVRCVIYTKFRLAMIAQLNKIWRVWAYVRAIALHSRLGLKGVLRNFTKFRGKHLCQSLIFNKVAGLRPTTLLKKRLWHRCFPVNFVKFLRTTFLQNTSRRLLLYAEETIINMNGFLICGISFWTWIRPLRCWIGI